MTPKYKRVLLKLSGEVFGGSRGIGFDYDVIDHIVDHIISIHNLNVEMLITHRPTIYGYLVETNGKSIAGSISLAAVIGLIFFGRADAILVPKLVPE